jgi:hypothetical protein
MKKPVKSTDPRKPAIMAALKKASGCTKVTGVQQNGENLFSGACMKMRKMPCPQGSDVYLSKWEHLGVFEVTL